MFTRFISGIKSPLSLTFASVVLLAGCGSSSESTVDTGTPTEENTPFTLDFTAKSAGETVACDTSHNQFGTEELHAISVSDLRFYISNLKFYNENNEEISAELDANDFQRHSEQGFVGLIDFTSNTAGACTDDALGGTERTNTAISGTIIGGTGTVNSVSFDVGVPQAVMKDVIATNTQEDAPTPLNELYWSWASGYRHFVMNFTIENTEEVEGKGLIHLGSRDCGGDGLLALEEKDTCDFVNTPKVTLDNFNPVNDVVVLDIDAMLNNVQFSATGDEVTPTVSCHSNPTQTDCTALFENFGLDITDGSADADANLVFIKE
ncbi:metallo-mystery pair system four-Cys motif protein [Colwellia sp. 6_MG-2023]|uniref:MbnP family copper-binding protein n=1 Tax=Colwellia sp. 6_MG-2023 TaxID=3062676 RepID=UPI0026E23C29|nr:MbnP family copper-binding protein [Colwellia sp. 6_MG-2023]MDO6489007.1 metallo-mystery pair system four-Cys motif protein [Colwellia sp. 6_MG-2023]